MRGFLLRFGCLAAAAMTIGGCKHAGFPDYSELPPDYSPKYTSITLVAPSGREKRVMAPEACLMPDKQSPADLGDPRLPPGCANNWNLQRMAERKRDLVRGRKLDPAPGATTARAAQRYLDGKEGTLGGGVDAPYGGGSSTSAGAGTTATQ